MTAALLMLAAAAACVRVTGEVTAPPTESPTSTVESPEAMNTTMGPLAGLALATKAPTAAVAEEQATAMAPVTARLEVLEQGTEAPDFEVDLLDGEKLRLSELKGKGVVLNFWASWCGPCRWEMPAFEKAWQEHQHQNIAFVGIAIQDFEKESRRFAEEVGVSYPLGYDGTGEIGDAYEVRNLPTTYFIDANGRVVRGLVGAVNEGALRIFLRGISGGE